MCNGDYCVMYPFFNLEPVKGFKCGSNVAMFRCAGGSADSAVLICLICVRGSPW